MKTSRTEKSVSRTKKYFFSILSLFALICFSLILLSTAFFSKKVSQIMTEAFAEKHQKSISQLSYLFDNLHAQLIPGLKESSYNNFSYSDLMYSYDLSTYEIKEGLEKLDDLLLSYPLIHSIYLYNGQMNFFLTTSSGLEDADTFYDKEVLTILNNFNNEYIDYYWPRTACFPQSPYMKNILVEKPTLTLLMGTTPFQNTQLKGALIVNLDMGEVSSLLTGEDPQSDDVVFIYNQKGEFITKTGQIDEEEMQGIFRQVENSNKEEGLIFEKNRLITFKFNFRVGWYFFGIMPLEQINAEINQVKRTIIIVMFLLMILAFLFSYLSARFIYSPINKLMNFMSSEEDRSSYLIERRNEISLIQQNYMSVMSEKDTLEDSLHNLNDDYRIEIFRSLLDGNQYHFWLDELEPHDQERIRGPIDLILFQIDDFYDSCSKMESHEFRGLRKKVKEIISRELTDTCEMLIDMTSRNLVCLSFGCKDPFDRIAALHKKILEEQPLSLTIGWACREGEDERDLHNLYGEAVEKAGEKFLTGYGKIHRTLKSTPLTHPIPAKVLDKFFAALMKYDRSECRERFENILSYLKEVRYNDYLQFINIFSYRFLILLRDRGDTALIPLLKQARNNPRTLETLETFSRFFSHITEEFIHEASQKNQKGLYHFGQIEEYISSQFRDPSFCVQSLSQMTGYSPNHLRKIYREFSEESLSDTINRRRLEEACRLLRETDSPVKEIFEQAGFTNYNSFFSSFKKGMGLTPALYRSKNQSDE